MCLDFANTVSNRSAGEPIERLTEYRDWLAWARQAGILTSSQAKKLETTARRQPDRAKSTLGDVRDLRESLYRLLSGIAAGRAAPAPSLESLNHALKDAFSRPRIVAEMGTFSLLWCVEDDRLDLALGPVVRSAAELLTSAHDLSKLRECAADDCGWLFLDTSRNKQRRWCDMKVCGNRSKARRYYQRQREA